MFDKPWQMLSTTFKIFLRIFRWGILKEDYIFDSEPNIMNISAIFHFYFTNNVLCFLFQELVAVIPSQQNLKGICISVLVIKVESDALCCDPLTDDARLCWAWSRSPSS